MIKTKKFKSTDNLWKKSSCTLAYQSKYISFEKADRFNKFYNWLHFDQIKPKDITDEKQTAIQVLRQFRRVVNQQKRITHKKQLKLQIDNKMILYRNLPMKVKDSIRASLVEQQEKRLIRQRQRQKQLKKRSGSLPNLNSNKKKSVNNFSKLSCIQSNTSKRKNPQSQQNYSEFNKGQQISIKLHLIKNKARQVSQSEFKRSNTQDLKAFFKNQSNSTNHQTRKLSKQIDSLQQINSKNKNLLSSFDEQYQSLNLLRKKSLHEIKQLKSNLNPSNYMSIMYNSSGHNYNDKIIEQKVKFKLNFNLKNKDNNVDIRKIYEGQQQKMSENQDMII